MKFTREELNKMEFNEHFSFNEADDDDDCCIVCGNEIRNLTIGYNEKEQLLRYICSNCDSVYISTLANAREDRVLLKGEYRNWPEYLTEKLKFPFEVVITEESDSAFFNDDYDGPRLYDYAKVLKVFYSFKYGVEALIRIGRRTYQHILDWVEVIDEDSDNFSEIENYKRWREKYWLSDYIAAFTKAFAKNKEDGGASQHTSET